MDALVTGATGFVGGHIARLLVARGASVRCLVREGSKLDNLEGLAVETVVGELTDRGSLDRAASGCSVVFHCAADYRLYTTHPDEMYAANVQGTANMLEAAAEAGVERVVYTSTVGALGLEADGSPASESTPVSLEDMGGHYKRSKYLAEREAERCVERGVPVVIVNPSAPVGEADLKPTPTGQVIVDFLCRRVPAYVDSGLNLVDVRDVAAGHLLAAERGKIGEKYILGCENLSLIEIFERLARLTGLAPPRVRLPHWIPLLAAACEEAVSRPFGRTPRLSVEAVRLSRYAMFFDAGKAVRELGLPQTPVDEALERAVAWFRRHGFAPAGSAR